MSLTRVIVVLGIALATLLVVVSLRAETTRVHFQIAELERRLDVLSAQIRREGLALERARRPQALLERVRDARLSEPGAKQSGAGATHSP